MLSLEPLRNLLNNNLGIEFAVLSGSRTNNSAVVQSDWDIATRWDKAMGNNNHRSSSQIFTQAYCKENMNKWISLFTLLPSMAVNYVN
ncbi:MAG: hypothetical protein M8364_07625 [Methylobacter sp.]|uniref:hypothetical protein n=1 Tax=Methylobacter sp. TaxID=2051955 RepID=UPI00258B819E|nr:hypothetical protein [Methylobacter sp.]MCL7420754.1 hypothetical protein [Methylobacter sp.]